jgi:hypothetical protein
MATKSYAGLKAILIDKITALVGGAYLSGTTTATTANKLEDSGADFSDVQTGDVVRNTTDNTSTTVTAVDSGTVLSLAADIFTNGEDYEVGAQLFDQVYGVNETEPEGNPICYVMEKTGGGQILDTHRNEREWQFDVVIHYRIHENATPEDAYAGLLDAADRVIQSFDEDPMLLDSNGQAQCKWVKVVPVEFEYATQDHSSHIAMITVAVVDIVSRYAGA